MGRPATVIGGAPAGSAAADGPILCDQAIFTSTHSGVGEGYRVVAASPGLQAIEKVEITRRSPSHGSLCGQDGDAVGLEAYTLPTRRRCVAYCCHAGCEQTARGGLRVYTHVAVLDRAAWGRFLANPVAVHAALAQHIRATGPVLRPAGRLEKIALALTPATASPSSTNGPVGGVHWLDCALAVASDLLSRRQVIVLAPATPLRLLEKVLLSLPLEVRENLDVSVGVKFSASRKMRLVVTAEPETELQRRIAGLDVLLRRLDGPAGQPGTAFAAWERLLRRWWREGRSQDVTRLTTELCRGISCDALDRIAAICEDTDAVDGLAPEEIRALTARYSTVYPPTKAEQTLVQELLQKATDRLADLQPPTDN
jgi:hypothetical protein